MACAGAQIDAKRTAKRSRWAILPSPVEPTSVGRKMEVFFPEKRVLPIAQWLGLLLGRLHRRLRRAPLLCRLLGRFGGGHRLCRFCCLFRRFLRRLLLVLGRTQGSPRGQQVERFVECQFFCTRPLREG